jgi:hypothetical protein
MTAAVEQRLGVLVGVAKDNQVLVQNAHGEGLQAEFR